MFSRVSQRSSFLLDRGSDSRRGVRRTAIVEGANEAEDSPVLEPSDEVGIERRLRQVLDKVRPSRLRCVASVEGNEHQDECVFEPVRPLALSDERVPEELLAEHVVPRDARALVAVLRTSLRAIVNCLEDCSLKATLRSCRRGG